MLFHTTVYIRTKISLIDIARPYSPDMNPIELCFGEGKAWLRKHQDVCEMNPQRCFEMALDQVFVNTNLQ